jgi:hypothetical protein
MCNTYMFLSYEGCSIYAGYMNIHTEDIRVTNHSHMVGTEHTST